MARRSLYSDLDLVPRGYRINPDWNKNFREDQNKVTRVIDLILDMTVRENVRQNNTMLSDVYFTKYWGVGNYSLVYRLKDDYHRIEVLIGAILESTDTVLEWYDLTNQFNFDIMIITPHRTIVRSYFDLLYEYLTMSNHSFKKNHPRIEELKEWLVKTRHRQYERITSKSSLSQDPYSYSDRFKEQRELIQLRGDITPREMENIREQDRYLIQQQRGIRPGQYDVVMNYDRLHQELIERQREGYQNQMSLRWSDIQERSNPCAEIELPNVTVKQRVSKLNKLLNKLKI